MHLAQKRQPETPAIPDRLYFKIGDVARICAVEPYVLRFWETQFPQLRPGKSGTGQRLYRRRDVELALEIKRLVHGEGYTISGAKQALSHNPRPTAPLPEPVVAAMPVVEAPAPAPEPDNNLAAALSELRTELREIATLLAGPQSLQQPRRRHRRLTPEPVHTDSLFPL